MTQESVPTQLARLLGRTSATLKDAEEVMTFVANWFDAQADPNVSAEIEELNGRVLDLAKSTGRLWLGVMRLAPKAGYQMRPEEVEAFEVLQDHLEKEL